MRCEDISKGSVSRSDKDLGAVVESARARPLDLRRRLAARRRHAVQAELLMRNFFTLTPAALHDDGDAAAPIGHTVSSGAPVMLLRIHLPPTDQDGAP